MDEVYQNGNGHHTPHERDVDQTTTVSIEAISKGSISNESEKRNSLTPEKRTTESSSNTVTMEKDPPKSRFKEKIRHHTPDESDVDEIRTVPIETMSKDVSTDSITCSNGSEKRNCLNPEKGTETSSNTGTTEKDPQKSRFKEEMRHHIIVENIVDEIITVSIGTVSKDSIFNGSEKRDSLTSEEGTIEASSNTGTLEKDPPKSRFKEKSRQYSPDEIDVDEIRTVSIETISKDMSNDSISNDGSEKRNSLTPEKGTTEESSNRGTLEKESQKSKFKERKNHHTPEESDVDEIRTVSIETMFKDVSTDSISDGSEKRNSLTPIKETSSNTGTLEKDRTKSRFKEKIRHFLGDKDRNYPPLTPLSAEKIIKFGEFSRNNNLKIPEIVGYLTKCHLDPEEIIEKGGKRAIHVVCDLDDYRLCDAFLQTGHSIHCQCDGGYTLLHYAVFKEKNKIVKFLLSSICSDIINKKANDGNTPIHMATLVRNQEAYKLLKSKRASFLVCNNKKQTPLHMAASMVKLFMEEHMSLEESNSEKKNIVMDKIMVVEDIVADIVSHLTSDQLTKLLQIKVEKGQPLHVFAEFNRIDMLQKICNKVNDTSVFEMVNSEDLIPFMVCLSNILKINEKKRDGDIEEDYDKDRIEKEKKRKNNNSIIPQQSKKRRRSTKKELNPTELALSCAKLLLPKVYTVDKAYPALKNLTALQILLRNVKQYEKSSDVERYLISWLLQNGADVDFNVSMVEEEPITIVTNRNFKKNDISILFIDFLQEETINYQDDEGDTVLHYAASLNDEEVLVKIFEKNAKIMLKNKSEILSDEDQERVTKPQNRKLSKKPLPRIPLIIALEWETTLEKTCMYSLKPSAEKTSHNHLMCR